MRRPKRERISYKNLTLMGVPKKYHQLSMKDFDTYNERDLIKVREFVTNYIKDLYQAFEENQGLFLFGSNGVGKTFIACMVVKEAYIFRYTARRVTFVEYVSAYTKMWGAKFPDEKEYLEQEFYNKYKAVEFLVIEEIGKEVDSKITAPILEDCLRYREDNGLPTVICTNLDLQEMRDRYGMSSYSLMQGNMTPILIEGKDKRRTYYNDRLEV